MSLAQGFPNTFTGQVTNQVTKNLDNETKKIYNNINTIMAADGHAHTGNGNDGALIKLVYGNLLINSGFIINNGNAGIPYVSGASLTAGQYGHEGWKAGASGCTYTFTQLGNMVTGINITAGSLIQPIESLNIIGGNYVASWTGTATARFNSGSYGASPLIASSVAASTQLNVEFGVGTLSKPKVNEGVVASPYYTEDITEALRRTQRYYLQFTSSARFYATGAGQSVDSSFALPATMRVMPTTTVINTPTNSNLSTAINYIVTPSGGRLEITASGAGDSYSLAGIYGANARL